MIVWTGNWIDLKWPSWRLRWDGDDLVWRRCWKYRTSQFPKKFSSEERVQLKKTEGIQTLNQSKCGFGYCRFKGVTFEVTSTDKVVSWTRFRGLSVNQDLGIYFKIDHYFNTRWHIFRIWVAGLVRKIHKTKNASLRSMHIFLLARVVPIYLSVNNDLSFQECVQTCWRTSALPRVGPQNWLSEVTNAHMWVSSKVYSFYMANSWIIIVRQIYFWK